MVDWSTVAAVLFDLDGVITPTAALHRRAWAETFAGLGFSDEDYLRHIDGRPRLDGVRAFLGSRGIVCAEGSASDEPDRESICGIGNRKDSAFRRLLDTEGIAPYPGTLRLIERLEAASIPMAVVTSSRNSAIVLDAAGLTGRFPVVVDGIVADVEGLAGKPEPATFLAGAQRLHVDPRASAVIEDAEAGVLAAVRGGFGLVIGVDRTGNAEALLGAGAHVVVHDLAETVPA